VFAPPCVHGRRKPSLGVSLSLNGELVWSLSQRLLQRSIISSRYARLRRGMVRPLLFGYLWYPSSCRGEYSSWLRRSFVSAHSDVQVHSAGLLPSLHSTTLAIDTAAEIPHREIPIAVSNIYNEDLPPPTCPPETGTMCQMTFSSV
jgi:hypothetical protein